MLRLVLINNKYFAYMFNETRFLFKIRARAHIYTWYETKLMFKII